MIPLSYAQSVAKCVGRSVKKLRGLVSFSFLAPLKSRTGFLTLRQTHFFTRDWYAHDREYSLFIVYEAQWIHSLSPERKEEGGARIMLSEKSAPDKSLPQRIRKSFSDSIGKLVTR